MSVQDLKKIASRFSSIDDLVLTHKTIINNQTLFKHF